VVRQEVPEGLPEDQEVHPYREDPAVAAVRPVEAVEE
jgi:hypothetical protein